MRWGIGRWTVSAGWRSRILVGLALAGAGYLAAVFLDFGPEPVPYAVMAAVVLTLVWLVLDTADAPPAHWRPVLSAPGDRADEATSDLRILSSHHQASVPSDAVRERLLTLAHGRDPDLAAALRSELAPGRRLVPAEIDRILTRIEESRD